MFHMPVTKSSRTTRVYIFWAHWVIYEKKTAIAAWLEPHQLRFEECGGKKAYHLIFPPRVRLNGLAILWKMLPQIWTIWKEEKKVRMTLEGLFISLPNECPGDYIFLLKFNELLVKKKNQCYKKWQWVISIVAWRFPIEI